MLNIVEKEEEAVIATVKISTGTVLFLILLFCTWYSISSLLHAWYMQDKMGLAGAYGILCTGLIFGAASEFIAYTEKISVLPQSR